MEKLNKILYKLEIYALKIIPFILAIGLFLNSCLSLLGITVTFIVKWTSISYLPLLFLYLSSYVFKFCEYHRIPLHYILVNNVLTTFDYWFSFNVCDYDMIIIHVLLFGFFSILCGILKFFKKI